MVTEAQALEQVLRFEHYSGFPTDLERPADQNELLLAFEDAAHDQEHAFEIANWLIRHRPMPDCRFCPVPAEVYAAAEATRPAESLPDFTGLRTKQPGDTAFNGLLDLVDDEFVALLQRKAENGKTHTEREDAKRFLERWHKRQKDLQKASSTAHV